jgi:transposase-like protein
MALPKIYSDETAARKHLETLLWPEGPICPHCGTINEATLLKGKSTRPGVYKCRPCQKPFSVTVGTVFERSKIALHMWVYATDLITGAKNGMSAHELHRMLKVTYKTAWFMLHRIRTAMDATNQTPMGGEGESIQADETYYGNTSKRAKHHRKGHKHKSGVVALVEPKSGQVRAKVMRATAENISEFLFTNVHRTSELHTDESSLYTTLGKEFAAHKTVQHGWGRSRGEYVGSDGQTTNNVENFFLQFKRGMRGTYIHVEPQHLQRYLNEFSFRYNHRMGLGVNDAARAEIALKGISGKRLTYRRVD